MNLIFKFIIFLLFVTTLNGAHPNYTNEELNYINNNKVKIAMLPHYQPFSYVENEELKGYSHDILELISTKSGLQFDYVIDTWPNNIKKFKNKDVDMIDSISFKESRLSFTNFTKPYYEIPILGFVRKDSNIDGSKESLKNKKFGMTKNVFYKTKIEQLNHFQIVEYDKYPEKVTALSIGDVDFIIGGLHNTHKVIKEFGYTNIKVLENIFIKDLKKSDLRFGVTKENKILHSIITKALYSIEEIEFENLFHKWLDIHSVKTNLHNLHKHKGHSVHLTESESDFLKNNVIKCVIAPSWEPFTFKDNGNIVGIAVDYWDLISKHINIISKCKEVETFPKVLNMIKDKKADITIDTTITKDKLKYSKFSKSYASYPISIATTDDVGFISNTSFLENKKVAVGEGYSAYTILKENYPKINFILVKNSYEALKMVSRGDAYAAVDILPVLTHYISKSGFSNLKISGSTEFDFNISIMIRDDYNELVSIINKSIDLISHEEKNDIRKKWTTVKYDKRVDYTVLIYTSIIIVVIALFLIYKQILLNKYNRKLEERIKEEVEKSRLKDRQMLHQSRLAQMGEMISMIAHQWRQPLTSIAATILKVQMYIEFDKFNLKKKKERDKFLKELNKEFGNMEFFIHTLTNTIDDFRNFYKPNKELELMYVSDVTKTSFDVIGVSLMNQKIDLIENYNCNKKIYLYKNELMQVILNIIKNSQDIFLEKNVQNPTICISTTQLEDDIKIEIRDNAGGIDKDILEKIFDPYFSTKNKKEGTGLGLYMSKIIIEDHHKGKLEVKNYEDGVIFSIYIPKNLSKEEN